MSREPSTTTDTPRARWVDRAASPGLSPMAVLRASSGQFAVLAPGEDRTSELLTSSLPLPSLLDGFLLFLAYFKPSPQGLSGCLSSFCEAFDCEFSTKIKGCGFSSFPGVAFPPSFTRNFLFHWSRFEQLVLLYHETLWGAMIPAGPTLQIALIY